jgi:stage II sporulation protein D
VGRPDRNRIAGAVVPALVLALGLALAMTGCAGPKRLPPLDQGSDSPGGYVSPGVPRFLTVGLLENAGELTLACTGPARIQDGRGRDLGTGLDTGRAPLICTRSGGQVVWRSGDEGGRSKALVVAITDPAHRLIHDENQYRGDFRIICTPDGEGLTLINTVEMESYLYGVVPWEIGRHGPEKQAALEAQAVAARTYTVSHLGARQARGFDVFASVMDQVYRGSGGEDPLCNQAVDATRGLVLLQGVQPINAYYSACCGGRSSLIQEVWPYPAQPYLQGRSDVIGAGPDPVCADYRYFNWREEWTRQELQRILARTLPAFLDHVEQAGRAAWNGQAFTPAYTGADPRTPGDLLNLEIRDYTPSGRIALLDIRCQAGTYHVRGDRVRWVLERPEGRPAILRSARFEVELTSRSGVLTRIAARGRGYGHGIGMCQAGALARAELGQDFRQILGHYYPGARLEKLAARSGRR